jgi:hypothetical protein
MYFQYPLPSLMIDSHSLEPNLSADVRLPSIRLRSPTLSPSPLTSSPKASRVVYRKRWGSDSWAFAR